MKCFNEFLNESKNKISINKWFESALKSVDAKLKYNINEFIVTTDKERYYSKKGVLYKLVNDKKTTIMKKHNLTLKGIESDVEGYCKIYFLVNHLQNNIINIPEVVGYYEPKDSYYREKTSTIYDDVHYVKSEMYICKDNGDFDITLVLEDDTSIFVYEDEYYSNDRKHTLKSFTLTHVGDEILSIKKKLSFDDFAYVEDENELQRMFYDMNHNPDGSRIGGGRR